MKKKLTLNEVVSINAAYKELINLKKIEPMVAMDIAENLMETDHLVEKTQKAYKPVEGTDEYNGRLGKIMRDLGATPSGGGSWSIPQGKIPAANMMIQELDAELSDFVKARNEYNKKFDEILERTVEVDLHTLYVEDIKDPGVTPSVLARLAKMGVLKRGRDREDIS
jgi:hypothetical protein